MVQSRIFYMTFIEKMGSRGRQRGETKQQQQRKQRRENRRFDLLQGSLRVKGVSSQTPGIGGWN